MNGNEPAFPYTSGGHFGNALGLTKREWVAGILEAGMLSAAEETGLPERMAGVARLYADALLAELDKGPKQ